MKRLIIIRGSSGSGKSWLADVIHRANYAFIQVPTGGDDTVYPMKVLATDDFWTKERPYNRPQVEEAHAWNQKRIEHEMYNMSQLEECTIIVPNTLPVIPYIMPLFNMAVEHGFEPQLITMQRELRVCEAENAWKDTDPVPTGQIRGQIKNMEFFHLDSIMSIARGTLSDQYCYECGYCPCRCKE